MQIIWQIFMLPFKSFMFLEKKVENFLISLNNLKESKIIPLMILFWPRSITPNMMTSSRIIIGLALLPIVWIWGFVGNYYLLLLLGVAAFTDLIDGPIARATRNTTRFGSLLDKIADKVLVIPVGVYEFWHIDKHLAVFSVAGTLVVTYTAISQYFHGKEVPENIFGKFATACYCVAIILPFWREAWSAAAAVGWTGFGLGLASAVYNFRRYYDITDQR